MLVEERQVKEADPEEARGASRVGRAAMARPTHAAPLLVARRIAVDARR